MSCVPLDKRERCAPDLEEAQEEDHSNFEDQMRIERGKINNWPAHILIKFVVIQLDLARVLHKQTRDNWRASLSRRRRTSENDQEIAADSISIDGQPEEPPPPPPVTRAAKLLGPSRVHLRICIAFYSWFALKFVLIRLIANGTLGKHLKWVDCYLWGRLRFPGRANKIGSEIELGFVIVCSLYRLYLAWLASGKKLHFPSLEFLLCDQSDLNEPKLEKANNKSPAGEHESSPTANEINLSPNSSLTSRHFGGDIGPREHWIMRPNRDLKSWLMLNRFCKWSLYCLVFILFLVATTSPFTYGGSIVTDFGYELAYPTCVAWIREQQVEASNNNDRPSQTSHIYRVEPVNKTLAYESPIEDLPFVIPISPTAPQIVREWRPYNIARIAFDIIEMCAMYLELVFQCLSLAFIVFLNALDAVINSNCLGKQLERLIVRLKEHKDHHDRQQEQEDGESRTRRKRRHSVARLHLLDDPSFSITPSLYRPFGYECLESDAWFKEAIESLPPLSCCSDLEQLICDITRAQALLHDHFSFVRGYNSFNNYNVATLTLNWTLYTIVVCMWIPSVRSRAVEMEFYLAELIGSCTVLIFIVIASFVHTMNVHLYRQITRLMALDNTTPITKLRWTSLMKFYFPRPLFCFTLYGSTGISRVFCLKLITWVSSFLAVMANFFYTVRN